jgi:cytochrome c oxidase assembly factor CtaG
MTALADQTIAGIIMKLGGGFLIWGTIAVIWMRWTREERQWDEVESSLRVG